MPAPPEALVNDTPQLSVEDYSIGWICATVDELIAAVKMLDEEHEFPTTGAKHISKAKSTTFVFGKVGAHNVVIASFPAGRMGISEATNCANELNGLCPCIDFQVMVGIGGAGGNPRKNNLQLGDVVISMPSGQHGGVVQYDFGKRKPDGAFERTNHLAAPPTELLKLLQRFRMADKTNTIRVERHLLCFKDLEEFQAEGRLKDILFKASFQHIEPDGSTPDDDWGSDSDEEQGPCSKCLKGGVGMFKERHLRAKPKIHYGTIASANQVMRDGAMRDKQSVLEGGILCYEMEAAGLMNYHPTLVFRGLCDYSDSHKNKLWQGYAAAVSAACAKEFLTMVPANIRAKQETLKEVQEGLLKEFPPYIARETSLEYRIWDRKAQCTQGTRVDLLNEIEAWARSTVSHHDSRRVFWLTGNAGTGKSTIALTVASRFSGSRDILAPSYFFSRSNGDLSNAKKFFFTLAESLLRQIPEIAPFVREETRNESPDQILMKPMKVQCRQLLNRPLQSLARHFQRHQLQSKTIVFVIDGLDECNDEGDASQAIQLLGEVAQDCSSGPLTIKLLATSRPELHLENAYRSSALSSSLQRVDLGNIDRVQVDSDIRAFLRAELGRLYFEKTGGLVSAAAGKGWPDEATIYSLSENANGLFIYASQICRFLATKTKTLGLQAGLEYVLEHYKELDDLYMGVLKDCIKDLEDVPDSKYKQLSFDYLGQYLGCIALQFTALNVGSVAQISFLPEDSVASMTQALRSVLDFDKIGVGEIQVYHSTFRDFLLEKKRSGDNFWVDEKLAQQRILNGCRTIMERALTHPNICALTSPSSHSSDAEKSVVAQKLSVDVNYACRYWLAHLRHCSLTVLCPGSGTVGAELVEFFRGRFMYWTEALSLMNLLSDGIRGVTLVLRFIEKESIDFENPLYQMLSNAERFLLKHRKILETAPLQAYTLGRTFSPRSFLHAFNYSNDDLRRINLVGENWDPLLQIFLPSEQVDDTHDMIETLSFSSDGTVVALATGSTKIGVHIKFWDMRTGLLLETETIFVGSAFELNPERNNSMQLLFSPNGKLIVLTLGPIGMRDPWNLEKSVRLLDLAKKAPYKPWTIQDTWELESRATGRIRNVSFSADSTLLAMNTSSAIWLWDLAKNEITKEGVGFCNPLQLISFSPSNHGLLACGFQDGSIAFWNVVSSSSGETLRVIKHDTINGLKSNKSQTSSKHPPKLTKPIDLLVFSKDGTQIAYGAESMIGICEIATSTCSFSASVKRCSNCRFVYRSIQPSPFSKETSSFVIIRYCACGVVLSCAISGAVLGRFRLSTVSCRENVYPVRRATLSPDGKLAALLACQEVSGRLLCLWDATFEVKSSATKLPSTPLKFYPNISIKISAIRFSPDGEFVATGSESPKGTVKIWNTATGRLYSVLEGFTGPITALDISPDGAYIATGSTDCTVRLLPVARKGTILAKLTDSILSQMLDILPIRLQGIRECLTFSDKNMGHLRHVTFSPPDGRILASTSYDGIIRLWNLATMEKFAELVVDDEMKKRPWMFTQSPYAVFSPDGTFVAGVVGGREILPLSPSKATADQLELGLSNKFGLELVNIGVWQVETGKRVATLTWKAASDKRAQEPNRDYTPPYYELSFSPCGGFVLVSEMVPLKEDVVVCVWALGTNTLVQKLTCRRTQSIYRRLDSGSNQLEFSEDVEIPQDTNLASKEIGSNLDDRLNFIETSVPSLEAQWKHDDRDGWLSFGGHKVMWFPWEYRPARFMGNRNTLVVGFDTGDVLIFGVDWGSAFPLMLKG
ncbi:WD40 repeat-like protein [Ascobolus immersus RN42]|uniref:WD40 repeat-like protein n=1 Tax=Ascobolus immersus RN42 TaxID=1160509 RepID=A0A3N4IB67_ASCIM|nr:WD40 repeat-like protein [Ascobolus immersus RN42]